MEQGVHHHRRYQLCTDLYELWWLTLINDLLVGGLGNFRGRSYRQRAQGAAQDILSESGSQQTIATDHGISVATVSSRYAVAGLHLRTQTV